MSIPVIMTKKATPPHALVNSATPSPVLIPMMRLPSLLIMVSWGGGGGGGGSLQDFIQRSGKGRYPPELGYNRDCTCARNSSGYPQT